MRLPGSSLHSWFSSSTFCSGVINARDTPNTDFCPFLSTSFQDETKHGLALMRSFTCLSSSVTSFLSNFHWQNAIFITVAPGTTQVSACFFAGTRRRCCCQCERTSGKLGVIRRHLPLINVGDIKEQLAPGIQGENFQTDRVYGCSWPYCSPPFSYLPLSSEPNPIREGWGKRIVRVGYIVPN